MFGFRCTLAVLLSINLSFAIANENNPLVDHIDIIEIKADLNLAQLVDLTVEKYPDYNLNTAFNQEISALEQRGNSLLAGAMSISANYIDDFVSNNGTREFEATVELPLWNWGQQQISMAVATKANELNTRHFARIKLKVAGLIRAALWKIKLADIRYEQSVANLEISKKLLEKVALRVSLGDLPQFDLLLAQSNHLEKKSTVVQLEAEVMHARKSYFTLTQMQQMPAHFEETQSVLTTIPTTHPELEFFQAQIQRLEAELAWVKSSGSGQPTLTVGAKSEQGSRDENTSESIILGISVPFGGEAHLAPEIAAIKVELTNVLVAREHVYRNLERELHEAEHEIIVTREELKIAAELKVIALEQLKMAQFGFAEGEINLLDVLKIHTQADNALKHVKEQEVLLQKYIALYNQTIGKLP